MRRSRIMAALALAGAASLLVSACSSSSKSAGPSSQSAGSGPNSSSPTSSSGSAATIKLGVLSDRTGVAASGAVTDEIGVKAYVTAVNAAGGVNGQKLSYVVADTTSTPAGALTAAQRLVLTDKVFAIITLSTMFYGAEAYLLKQGVPVIGTGFDGPEWTVKSNTNLLDAEPISNPSNVYSTTGDTLKSLGATTCGSIGYSASPSAVKSAEAAIASCTARGLKKGYLTQVAFGSTDMAPVALAMKSAGVDGMSLSVLPATGFALAAAMRQVGDIPKAFLLLIGYGGDLLSNSAAVTAAQGFEFTSVGEPVEMNTPATQAQVKALAAVGETRTPTSAEQNGYIDVAAVVRGLTGAGANPTPGKFLSSLRAVKDFDADGLLSPEKIDFSDYDPQQSCSWVVKLQGNKFVPLPNIPICGKKVGTI